MANYAPVPVGLVRNLLFKCDQTARNNYFVVYSNDNGLSYFVYASYKNQRIAEKVVQGFRDVNKPFSFTCFWDVATAAWFYIESSPVVPT